MSKLWATEIKAKSPLDGQIRSYGGPRIPAETYEEAQEYCELNGLGYCWIIGRLVAELPCNEETFEIDWDNMINYDDE